MIICRRSPGRSQQFSLCICKDYSNQGRASRTFMKPLQMAGVVEMWTSFETSNGIFLARRKALIAKEWMHMDTSVPLSSVATSVCSPIWTQSSSPSVSTLRTELTIIIIRTKASHTACIWAMKHGLLTINDTVCVDTTRDTSRFETNANLIDGSPFWRLTEVENIWLINFGNMHAKPWEYWQ